MLACVAYGNPAFELRGGTSPFIRRLAFFCSQLGSFRGSFWHSREPADDMLVSTSLRAVARRGAGLCVLRAARRGCSLTVGTSEGRRWPCGRTVASSSSSAPSSSTPRPNDVPMMSLHVLSSSKHATDVLAAYFATATGLAPGDCFLLFGPVGAGKSHFSRAFIRYAMDDDELEVPSPTFLLHNSYERNERVVHHYDLYRLMDAREGEYERLDLSGSFASGVSLIEWPERLVQMGGVPAERVELRITLGEGDGMNGRHEHDQRGAEEDRDEEDETV